jgi:hypothetical protein
VDVITGDARHTLLEPLIGVPPGPERRVRALAFVRLSDGSGQSARGRFFKVVDSSIRTS